MERRRVKIGFRRRKDMTIRPFGGDNMRLELTSPLFAKSASVEVKYEYATTQAVYDGETTRDLLDFIHDKIDPEDVYESEAEGIKGKERKPHITLLYGIKERKPNVLKLEQLIQNHPAMTTVGWAGLGKFEAEKYDVLFIEIDSPEAHELFADLTQFYPDNANKFPQYHPHTCLAYMQKGKADKYIEEYSEAFVDPAVPIHHLEFEFNGEITEFDPATASAEE